MPPELLRSSMAMCPSCRLFGNFSLNGRQVHASGCSGCHGSVFCKHRPRGGYEKWGDMVFVLVDCLFEEGPQICGEAGMHQRLHKDWFAGLWSLQASLSEDHSRGFLCGLFVDIGQIACHTAQPIYARGAGVAS